MCGFVVWVSYFNGNWVHIKKNGKHIFSISENAINALYDLADDITMEIAGARTDIKLKQGHFEPLIVTMHSDDSQSTSKTYSYPSLVEINKVFFF